MKKQVPHLLNTPLLLKLETPTSYITSRSLLNSSLGIIYNRRIPAFFVLHEFAFDG